VRFAIAAKTRLIAPLMPHSRLFTVAQKARGRQDVAHGGRVVRKMAQTIESI
jgi:hypothetical protein